MNLTVEKSSNPITTEFVTVSILVYQLGVKYYALLQAVNDGLMPSYKPFGDRRLVKSAEVMAYIERTPKGGAV